MIRTFKRGKIFHFSTHVAGRRLRGSLGTTNPEIARKLASQLEYAASSGPQSEAWHPLRLVLPPVTVRLLNGAMLGPPPSFTLQEIERAFSNKLDRQLKFGRLASGTVNAYEYSVGLFVQWLPVRLMDEVTTDLLERYFLERQEQIKRSPHATNGRGVLTDVTAIRKFIQFCAEEKFMPAIKIPESPKPEGQTEGAEAFTQEELQKMESQADGVVRLIFLLFRWTGMRASDVAALTWNEIDFNATKIRKVTQKRKKLITVPLAPVLLEELKQWRGLLQPELSDKVVPNTPKDKLYRIVQTLGKKSGVEDAHPHRFRSSFVVYLLEKGASIYDAAQILGDTVSVTEAHYAKFTESMQDRVRKVLEVA